MHQIAILAPLALLAACATAATPTAGTSWGKPGVAMVQYWTDSSECAIAGAAAQANGHSNVEGVGSSSDYSRTGAGSGSSAQGGNNDLRPVGTAAGAEVNTNMYDVASRAQYAAALQHRNDERVRQAALQRCLSDRGYRQFRLTAEQSAHLATLPEGSPERRTYLHQLGSDPVILNAQGL